MGSTARVRAAIVATLIVALAGCSVSVSTKTFGAATVDDLQAEMAYIAVYTDQMTTFASDSNVFAPSGSNPGPCNKGGNKQDCFNADAKTVTHLNAMLDAFRAAKVPPRFTDADRLLRDAASKQAQALQLRNQALANSDNAAWTQANQLLQDASAAWTAAYAAFPADNRPAITP